MIDELKKNVEVEIKILREISNNFNKLSFCNENDKRILIDAIDALRKSMKLVNNSIPSLLKIDKTIKRLPSSKKAKIPAIGLERVNVKGEDGDVDVVLKVKDKEKFFRELSISENLLKKIKKRKTEKEKEDYVEFKGARGYLKLSNKFFLDKASVLIEKGFFKSLSKEIKKSNIDILFETYVAMMLFSTFLSVFISFFIMIFFLFFNISPIFPFFSLYEGSYLLRLAKIIWIPLVVPICVFLAIYFYPSSERKVLEKRINQELPFAVIHMSAISGSGIAPSNIFYIIGTSNEYPYLKKEFRKILNQINLYGYDLVNALKNASRSAPSEKLAELFSGISTTITSGASLTEFFEKRAESLLMSYRLEREKYTRLAETFMDIYISVVIAAPMVLLLLLILLSITGAKNVFAGPYMSLMIVGVVALLNILFLWFLQIKQPSY